MHGGKATAVAKWCAAGGMGSIRFDYRGNGESAGRFEDMTIGDWLDDARAMFRTFARGPQIVVGSSMGGWLAVLLARAGFRTEAAHIAALVLIAPAIDMTERLIRERLTAADADALAHAGRIMRPSAYGDGPYPITRRLIEEGREHLLGDDVLPIGVPVHIIHGVRDPDVPVEISRNLTARLAGTDVRLTLVPDGDHRLSRSQDIALILGVLGAMRNQISAAPAAQSAPSPSR